MPWGTLNRSSFDCQANKAETLQGSVNNKGSVTIQRVTIAVTPWLSGSSVFWSDSEYDVYQWCLDQDKQHSLRKG